MQPLSLLSLLLCVCLHANAQSTPTKETLLTESVLAAYRDIFLVQGNPTLVDGGMPVQYILDRICILLHSPPNDPIDISGVRTLSQAELSKILLYAVAGTYVTGKGSMSPDACHITADPSTGLLQVSRDKPDSDVVLTAICLILVTALAAVMYREEKNKT